MKWVTWVKFSAMIDASPLGAMSRNGRHEGAAGVVHQHVDPVEAVGDRLDEGVDGLRVADVELGAQHRPPEALDVGRHLGQQVGLAVADRHRGPAPGEQAGGGPADPLGARR